MQKGIIKRVFAAVLAGIMLFGNISLTNSFEQVQAAEVVEEEIFSVSFVDRYAAVGQALTPVITGGSDISCQWYVDGVLAGTEVAYTPKESDLNKWIEVVVTKAAEQLTAKLYCSKLPVVYIDTEGGQAITSKEKYINANIRVQGNDQYRESNQLYNGLTEIRGRGNSTWSQPKKPYRLKLDKKTDMFGMGEGTKSKHWVLLANYLDESLLRNTLAYDMSGEMGMEHLSTVWVDVVMNGEYVGNYQFCENVRVDEDRVDIFDWEGFAEDTAAVIAEAEGMDDDTADDLTSYMAEESMQWITSQTFTFNGKNYNLSNYENGILELTAEDYGYELSSVDELADLITGGYILELDEYYDEVSKFRTDSNQPIMFKNPEFVNTNSDMFNYVRNYVQAFENAVRSDDYKTVYAGESVHYSDLYDFEALIDYWLVTEIFYNEEINKKSTYMYKDVDGLMIMGPIWDMDWSSGAGGTSADATDKWATKQFSTNAQAEQWYKDLVQDPYFLMKAQERYWEIRDVQVQDMLNVIDGHIDYLEESGQADYETWRAKSGRSTSFASDSANLKSWLNTHVTWMDGQMQTEDSIASAFFTPSGALSLTLTDKNGSTAAKDVMVLAPADALVGTADDAVLKIEGTGVNGTAHIFVNGKVTGRVVLSNGSAQYTVGTALLTEAVNEKNIIEVKVTDDSGNVIASNYVTVKRTDCVHEFDGQWESDEEYHWGECTKGCGYKSSLAKHTFTWIIDREATKEASGIKHEECDVCAFRRSENTEVKYVDVPSSPDDDSKDISVKNMVAISGNEHSQTGAEGPDDNVLDDNPNTIWHTKYGVEPTGGSVLDNRWIGVNLDKATTVNGIRYLPRQGAGANGKVTEYEIQYRETDDGEWITVASGTWNQNDSDWKYVGFSAITAKQIRLVGVRTYAGSGLDRHMTCAEFRVTGVDIDVPSSGDDGNEDGKVNNSLEIPVSQMTATAGDYDYRDVPENAIDEDESTLWHTNWNEGLNHDNHWLQLELKDVYEVDGLRYLPRLDTSKNGIITEYEIYTSLDGADWTKVAAGEWTSDKEWKSVAFDAVEAKYVKIVTISATSENATKFASAAEIRLTGTKDGEAVPPEKDLTVAFDSNYAEVGKVLSVTTDAEENVSYIWKVNGNQVSTSDSYTPTVNDLEKWIEVEVIGTSASASAKMYCSKLPVVYIDTEGGQAITSKEKYIDATIKLQGNAQYSDSNVLYEGATEIKGRGNSTWSQPKKPYRLKFDKKADAFGMGKSKHWVLLANYLDESLMRNTLAYDLSGSMDMEQMSTVWVDVILNGTYVGNYQFCENIRVDEDRVEIFDWESFAEDTAAVVAETEGMDDDTADDLTGFMAEENMQWITSGTVTFQGNNYKLSDYEDDVLAFLEEDYGHAFENIDQLSSLINGGYILELDEYYDEVSKFKTNSNQPIMFKNPEFVSTNSDMLNFVKGYVQAFEDAVRSADYTSQYEGEDKHYSELYDFDSLVDYWLISEIFFNEELNKKSTYMYKGVNELMKMGPIWDMDWSSGGEGNTKYTNRWATLHFGVNAQAQQWYKYLVKDPYFLVRAQERYWEIRDVQIQDMLDIMDDHYELLKESGAADGTAWGKGNQSFYNDYTNLNSWLNTHITWMDSQMETEDTFDTAFLSKNSSLKLDLTEADGTTLDSDTAEKAPADVLSTNGEAVKLQISGVSGSAEVFVNGVSYSNLQLNRTGTTVEVEASALNAEVGAKNVIEVKVYDNSGNVTAKNYVTLKTYEAEKETTPVTEAFKDVKEDDWFVDAVQFVYDNGIMGGSNRLFNPAGNITREQVVATLFNMEADKTVTDYTAVDELKDLKAGQWYTDAVCWAYNVGVAQGNSSTKLFSIGKPITREQLAVMLYNYSVVKGYDVSASADYSGLKGANEVSDYATGYMSWAYGAGLIGGNGNLNPKGNTTRAQMASMMMQFVENVVGK